MRTWLMDRESSAYPCLENPSQPVDLPWPATAATAARNKQLTSLDQSVNATLNDDRDNSLVSDILISENTKIALRLLSTFWDTPMTSDELSDLARDEGGKHVPGGDLRLIRLGRPSRCRVQGWTRLPASIPPTRQGLDGSLESECPARMGSITGSGGFPGHGPGRSGRSRCRSRWSARALFERYTRR